MNADSIDFGDGVKQTGESPTNNQNDVVNQADTTALDGSKDTPDITGDSNANQQEQQQASEADGISSTGELKQGDSIEFEGELYTVDANGNLVDADNNIFKEAKDVKNWLSTVTEDDNSELSVNAIKDAFGIDIVDENGNPVEFTNDVDGLKSYVDSVINVKATELQEAAINKLYADNPLLKQFNDYVKVTGSAKGFGDVPDRSNIVLNENDEAQQVAIIKMAASEFGNKSINDNYINYLHDTGALYEEAKIQLNNLVEADKAYQRQIEEQAAAARQQEQESLNKYWQSVNDAISKRVIGGYKIPESFTKTVNGQKIILTPNDFYNYISQSNVQTEDGGYVTHYQNDLNNLTNEDYLNRELLDAWLMFTGGSYKDLIDMAVKEDNVRKLKLKANEQRTSKTIKVNRKSTSKVNINDILLQ